MTRFPTLALLASASAATLSPAASAQLTAYDPFAIGDADSDLNYEDGESLRSNMPPTLGFDPSIIWGGNSGNFITTTGSLDAQDPTGKVNLLGVGGPASADTRFLARNLTPQSSSTFYMGSLVNTGSFNGAGDAPAPINAGSYALTGFINEGQTAQKLAGPAAGGGNLFGLTWGVGGNAEGDGFDLILRDRHNPAGTGAVGSDITVANRTLLADAAANTTYEVLLKFEFATTAEGTAGTGNDLVTYWIGDPGSFNPLTDADASATAISSGVLGSYGFNTPTDLTRGVFAQNSNENGTIFFDNLALGLDIATVSAAINPVPEPASAALLAAGAGLLLRRRTA